MPQSHNFPINSLSETVALTDLTALVPFPNYLIDKVMPGLTGSEWNLLCVIVRQTLGWQAGPGGRRKLTDWLTHGQLKVRTGRSSAMISRALDSLVRKSLVEVRDSQQQPLLTPQARRGCGGRLYFRLGPIVLSQIMRAHLGPDVMGLGSNVAGKPSTSIKVTRGLLETENQKVKTTKATEIKYLSNDKGHGLSDSALQDKEPAPGVSSSELPNPEVKRFLTTYRRLFRQHTISGDPPAMAWAKDGKLVKDLLKIYTYERLETLLHQFFADEDAWIEQRGYSLAAFKTSVNRLLMQEQRPQASPALYYPALRSGQWSKAGQRRPAMRLKLPRRATGRQQL